MSACQITPISELVKKNNLWYKKDKTYTGKVYGTSKAINNENIYDYYGVSNFGDSLVLNFENGEIKRVDFYNSKGHSAKQEFLADSIVQLEFYYTEVGIWNEELIAGTACFRKGKPHGLKSYYFNENKNYMYYNNGKLERQTTFSLSPSLWGINETLLEEREYKSESNTQITKEYYKDGKTLRKKSEINDHENKSSSISFDLNGKIIEKIIDGQKMELSINGSVKTYNNFGGITLEEYKDGKKNGIERQYYASGKLRSEITYHNGIMHGTYKSWYKNGKMAVECTYIENAINGNYRKWYENGQLWEQSIYKNSELISRKKWYKNGKTALN